TDPAGATLTVTGVSATSTNGGNVTMSGGAITYTPLAGFTGTDMFTYTVNDGTFAATGSVLLTVANEPNPVANRISNLIVGTNGVSMHFAGIPGYGYTVERSTDAANWTTIGNIVAPANGQITYLDGSPPPGPVYYRTTSP